MTVYRVLVVDDSAFMRKIFSDLIVADASFEIAGTASNGREAVEQIGRLKPDLVTMDVEMPEMNGLEALKLIMKECPLPVIMLSAINEQGMKETIIALENGAFDFIRKPSISNSHDIAKVGVELLERLKAAVQAAERKQERSKESSPTEPALSSRPPAERKQDSQVSPPKSPHSEESAQAVLKAQPNAEPKPATAQPLLRKELDEQLRRTWHELSASKSSESRKTEPRKAEVGKAQPPKSFSEKKPADTSATKKLSGATARPLEPVKTTPVVAKAKPPTVSSLAEEPAKTVKKHTGAVQFRKLVAVGCSTGGPRALKAFLEQIPGDFPAPVVIVQHMPPNFTRSLAQRLNSLSAIRVVEAEQGMTLESGTAYIAPGGYQLRVTPQSGGKYAFSLTTEEPRNGHRPSVDTMFESLAPLTTLDRHLVLLTGMGSDGARMMKKLYDSGVRSTFAENEETCVVYGMPRSAVELNCVQYLLPLHQIAPKLVQVVK